MLERFRVTSLSAIALAACAATPPLAPPDVPPGLRPPAGQVAYVEALATGVQIYECSRKGDTAFEWAFRAPEASLADRSGYSLGKHYAGPTWESTDGSTVVGEVKARDPGPTPSAIPWLLLSAKANTGSGTFSAAKSIQRIATVGGVAPVGGCGAASVGRIERVPYTATYYFYR
jgi:FtsP/CotA-like multicopper oxidase with cupredoxin domain